MLVSMPSLNCALSPGNRSMQVPNGELNAQQLRFLGDAIAPFGEAGCGDITTRANIQLRGMTLAEADQIFAGLQRVGLSSVQTGAEIEEPWGDKEECSNLLMTGMTNSPRAAAL